MTTPTFTDILGACMSPDNGTTSPETVGQLRVAMMQIWANEQDKIILRRLSHAMVIVNLDSILAPSCIHYDDRQHQNDNMKLNSSSIDIIKRLSPLRMALGQI